MRRVLSLIASCLVASAAYSVDISDTIDGGVISGFWASNYEALRTTAKSLSGTSSLAFKYLGKPDGQDSTAELRFFLPQKMSEVYIEYDLFIPPNYYHRKQSSIGYGSDNNKSLVQLWSGEYGAKASNIYVGMEQWPAGDGGSNPSLRMGSNHEDLGHVHMGKMAVGQEIIRVPEDLGKWRHFKVHVKLADAGKANGIVEVWRDNDLIIKSQPLNNYSAAGNYLTHGYILGWSNSGYAQDTTFYVDNFKVSGTGFSGVIEVAPNPPVLKIQ